MANDIAFDPAIADQFSVQRVVPLGMGRVAGTNGVTPDAATTAIQSPGSNVPPVVGMQSPDQVAAAHLQAVQAGAMRNSPAVAQWAQTADPSHLAVTKDDLPSLAKIGSSMATDWLGVVHSAYSAYNAQTARTDAAPLAQKPVELAKSLVAGYNAFLAPVSGALFAASRYPSQLTAHYIPDVKAAFNNPTVNALDAKLGTIFGTAGESRQANVQENLANVLGFLGVGGKAAESQAAFRDLGTIPSEPVPDATSRLPGPGSAPPEVEAVYEAAAHGDVAHVEAVQEQVAASKTQGRSPAVMEAYLAQQPVERPVQVDTETLAALAEQGHTPFPEADLTSVQPTEVPLSRYLAQTAGQPFAADLNETTVFRPGGVSVADSKVPPTEEGLELPGSSLATPADFTPEESTEAKTLAARHVEAVNSVTAEMKLSSLFSDPKTLGMTKPQFEAYNLAIENAHQDAIDKVTARAYNAIKAERTEPFKTALTQHTAAVEQELAAQPAIRARAYLAQGKDPLGAPVQAPFKLSRSDAIAQYGSDLGLPARYFSANGVTADEAADTFGYSTGADLMRDLAALNAHQGDLTVGQHMKSMVGAIAKDRARIELGYDMSPKAIQAAASQAVNSPKLTDFLLADLKSYADQHDLPFDKDALRAKAREDFAGQPVSDGKNVGEWERRVFVDARKVEIALLDSDPVKAFRWKQAMVLDQLQLKEAHKFSKEFARNEKVWGKVAKAVGLKGVSPSAVNWVKDIIATTGRAVKGNPADFTRPIAGHNELSSFIAEKNDQGGEIIPVPVPRGVDPNDMTVGQYKGVAEMVKAILAQGRRENQIVVGGVKQDLRENIDQGVDSLNRYSRTITEAELNHPSLLQALDKARRVSDAWLVRWEQLMLDFGARDPHSPFFQAVTRPLQEAKGEKMDHLLALAKHFHTVSAEVGKGFDKWLGARVPKGGLADTITHSDGSPVFVKNKDVLIAALHLGDEGALQALAASLTKLRPGANDGPERIAETAKAIQAVVNAHATPAMWRTVRGIWDAFDALRPEILRKYTARTGVTPDLIPPRSFPQADGTVNKGGYFPIIHDMAQMPKEWQLMEDGKLLGSPHYVRAVPSNSHMTARTGAIGPMSMNLDRIYSRLNQTVHDLAFRDVLADINRFLLHPEMKAAIRRKYGPEYVSKIETNLKDIAGAESVGHLDVMAGKAIDYLSEAQLVNMIGFSPSTMIKHGTTALGQAMTEMGPLRYAASVQRFMLNPAKLMRQAEQESPDIRHVLSSYNEDTFEQFIRLSKGRTKLSKAALSLAFHFVGGANKLVSVPLYDAAKLKIADEHPELDTRSVQALAGQTVRQVMGSTGPTDSAQAMRFGSDAIGKLARLSNPFMAFLNHMYNRQREIPQSLGVAGERPDLGRAVALLLAYVVLPTYVGQAVARKTFATGKTLANKLAYWAAGFEHEETGGMPWINSAVAAAMHKIDPKDFYDGDNALLEIAGSEGQAVRTLFRAATGKHITEAEKHNLLIAGGYIGKYPGSEAAKLEAFFHKLHTGREKDWKTVLQDLTAGPSPGSTK